MNILSIHENDAVNSITGFTTTIYVAGCPHHCLGCFSPQTWDYNQGKDYSVCDLLDIILSSKNKNVTFLGGDPLNELVRDDIINLIKLIKGKTNKNIYLWTGYKKEEVEKWIDLSLIDYLIDGRFEIDKKDIRLNLRGSVNQRVFHCGVDITQKIDIR